MEVKIGWKNNNKKYVKALEKFFDKVDNIEDEVLRAEIIGAALKCDEILTNIAICEIDKNNQDEIVNNNEG